MIRGGVCELGWLRSFADILLRVSFPVFTGRDVRVGIESCSILGPHSGPALGVTRLRCPVDFQILGLRPLSGYEGIYEQT